MATAVVMYSNENPDSKFDLDYYLKTHMPLVAKNWGQYGLKEWQITRMDGGIGGSPPQFRIHALLSFDSADSIQKALQSEEAKTVFGDVPNFTDISPVFLSGEAVGSAMV